MEFLLFIEAGSPQGFAMLELAKQIRALGHRAFVRNPAFVRREERETCHGIVICDPESVANKLAMTLYSDKPMIVVGQDKFDPAALAKAMVDPAQRAVEKAEKEAEAALPSAIDGLPPIGAEERLLAVTGETVPAVELAKIEATLGADLREVASTSKIKRYRGGGR